MAIAAPENRPDTRNAASAAMQPDITLVRDLAGGTSAVRKEKTAYLPQYSREDTADYTVKLNRAVVFNAFKRTVEAYTGMVFRKDIALSNDVPDPIAALTEDIDNAGTHLDVFAKSVFHDALEAGHAGILVDAPLVLADKMPATRAGPRGDRRAEAASGVRPYWVHVPAEDVMSWRWSTLRGQRVLSQLVLRSTSMEPAGAFGEARITRYRVFNWAPPDTVTWQLWEQRADEAEPGRVAEGPVGGVTRIPFVPVYGEQTGDLESQPPLLDLAHLNIAHYQLRADYWQSLHMANTPILTVIGATVDQLESGPNTGLVLPDPQSRVQYTEHAGTAHADTREELRDIKTDMAVLGLGMLQHETRAAETAEAKRIDKSEQDSALSTAARSLQDGLESSLDFTAQYMGLPDGGSLTVNRDFERLHLDASDVTAYMALYQAGTISLDTLWSVLKEGGSLPDDFDADLEWERIQIAEGKVGQ